MPVDPHPKRGLLHFLKERHRELESACSELLGRASTEEPRRVLAWWTAFDAALREHMTIEEELVLPEYQDVAPLVVCDLRAEHAWIRELLDEISEDVRRQQIHADRIRTLVDRVRAHEAREDAVMYPWIERHLPLAGRRRLLARLGASVMPPMRAAIAAHSPR